MKLNILYSISFCLFAQVSYAQSSGTNLQGSWKITSILEDGLIISENEISSKYVAGGTITIKEQLIEFSKPGTNETKTLLFTLNEKASPKEIDLGGSDKLNGKGIFIHNDDTLLLCFGNADARNRPGEFSAKAGSGQLMMTLKRISSIGNAPIRPPVPPAPVNPPKDDDARKKLIGTWGHQSEDWIHLITLNDDGTFSSLRKYKKRIGKLLNPDVQSSGTWKLDNGVILAKVTASTDRDMNNQYYSYKIRSVSATELICVDQFGHLWREWKTR